MRAAARPASLRPAWLSLALAFLVAATVLGVLMGPVRLGVGPALAEIADRLPFVTVGSGLTDQQQAILWELRIPRVVLAGLVGATLALAGAAYQGVFRNPLADPYLLGVAAGAGLGATIVIAWAPPALDWPVDPLPLAAFAGALLGVSMTYVLGRAGGRARTAATLILAGVATASFLTAIQTYVQQREDETVRQVYTWILGQLTTASWREVTLVLPYLLIGGATIVLHRRLLDVLSVGDEEAASLGVDTQRVRVLIVVAASLGTAAAVSVSGLIGFVGVIVPHTVRLVFGTSYRLVIPLSLVFGAAFLILADLVGRSLIAPAEIPIGVITAFLGAPFFLVVLRRSGRVA
ncbi:MAG: iron ABC transporter permease [Actinomycetota bacterium]|nr:iron ABC transporter permease [Actinomycetota bacterium]